MKSSKMFVLGSEFQKYAMLDINCNKDAKNYVSSDQRILKMFTLWNMDFEMKLNSEQQRTLLLSYTYVKI
jgi:hypothetical protein